MSTRAWGRCRSERAVGEQALAGRFFKDDLIRAEEPVDFIGFFLGKEENFARAAAPFRDQVLRGEEDMRRVGERAAEEHGTGAAVDQADFLVDIEGNRRAVRLVAKKEDVGVWGDEVPGAEVVDSFREIVRGKHRGEAVERGVRGDEEDGAGKRDGDGGSKVLAATAEQPPSGGADREGEESKACGESQRSEGRAGEVEEVGHGERVVAHAAVGEQVADIWNESKRAGAPQAVSKRGGNGEADDGVGDVSGEEGLQGPVFRVRNALGASDGRADQHQQREVDGEGVVLLIGRDCEEDEDEGGVDAEQQDGTAGLCFREVAEVVTATPAEDCGEWSEQAPREKPDEVQRPVEVAGELVVVARNAAAEEAQKVLVDEVEPEEAVAVFSSRVSQTGEDVPRGRDHEEESEAGERLQAAPLFPGARDRKVNKGRAEEEDERDESLGQDSQSQGHPHNVRTGPAYPRSMHRRGVTRKQECIKRDAEEK